VDGGEGDPTGHTRGSTSSPGTCGIRATRRIHVARAAGDGDRRPEEGSDRSAREHPRDARARSRRSSGHACGTGAARRPNAASDGSLRAAERAAPERSAELAAAAVRTAAQRAAELGAAIEPAPEWAATQRRADRPTDVCGAAECATELTTPVERSSFEPAAEPATVEPATIGTPAERTAQRTTRCVAPTRACGAEPPQAVVAPADTAGPDAGADGDQGDSRVEAR
jgi:hypothetical protein